MLENHGIDRSVVKVGLKKTADATFRMGTLEAGSQEREVELRQHIRSFMLACIGAIFLIALPIGLITENRYYGIGSGFAVIGVYSLITGRAVLKPGPTQHSLFLGWKARVIGVILLLAAFFMFGSMPNP